MVDPTGGPNQSRGASEALDFYRVCPILHRDTISIRLNYGAVIFLGVTEFYRVFIGL